MDTWILLSTVQSGSERNRVLYVLKSRGMAHSNQVREFVLTNRGIELDDVYTGERRALHSGEAVMAQARRSDGKGRKPNPS
jgi:circadian clock protein KaiC